MATKKIHRDFPRMKPENLVLRKKFYLGDTELMLLSNYVIYQEFQILLTINSLQKWHSKPSNNFRIPYGKIEEFFGIKRTLTKRHLSNLKQKEILVITSPMNWSWNIPAIAKMIGPVEEELKSVSRTETLSSELVIFINNPLEDPILKGLPKDWDKI